MDGRLIIANQRIKSPDRINSTNPANLEVIDKFCLASAAQCREAVDAAKNAFPGWRDLPAKERTRIFRRVKHELLRRQKEVAEIVCREKGTPLSEAIASEVFAPMETVDYYIHKRHLTLQPRKTRNHIFLFYHKKASFRFHPQGPTLIISPWNYPFLIPFLDTMSALSAGNTVVLRPSSSTSLSALLLGEIFIEAGIPPGVLNVIPCKTTQAEQLVLNPEIKNIMFTGSSGIGKRIMELASRNLTDISLELGGKDPMVVCHDADLDRAAQGAVWGAFTNTGQSCGSVERLYVAEEVAAEFIEKVLALTKALKVGNPLDPDMDIGPMTTFPQLTMVESHIKDAQDKGAKLKCGGERLKELRGYFLQPAVLTGVNHSMKIMQEETFGPTLPIQTFSHEDEAVALANDSDFGLTASVWTRNRKRAFRLAERIEAGSVTINDHMFSFTEPSAIWGGIKQTGIGRSHGPYGLLNQSYVKYISSDFRRIKSLLWWYPYKQSTADLFKKAMTLYHHENIRKRIGILASLIPSLPALTAKIPVTNILKSMAKLWKK